MATVYSAEERGEQTEEAAEILLLSAMKAGDSLAEGRERAEWPSRELTES